MRSVVVVLPASMCAAMPMLRVRSRVYLRFGEFGEFTAASLPFATAASAITWINKTPRWLSRQGVGSNRFLPAEMCEGLVGLGHFMHFVALANRVPLSLIRFHDFRREGVLHRRALARISKIHNP